MEDKILCFGIENEYEGIGTLWFKLSQPETIANYIKENIEPETQYSFQVKEMTAKEFADLQE